MFRKIKKKPTTVAAKRTRLEEDATEHDQDNDTEQQDLGANQILMQKKKQRRGPGIRAGTTFGTKRTTTTQSSSSSSLMEAPPPSAERTTVRVQKRPRVTGGLGYGGAGGFGNDQNDKEEDDAINDTSRDTSHATRYDANSLSQLRQQQDVFETQQVTPDDWNTLEQPQRGGAASHDLGSGDGNETSGPYFKANNLDQIDNDDFGRNFIPIDDGAPNSFRAAVLNGDEAMAYANPNDPEEPGPSGRSMGSVLDQVGVGSGGGPQGRDAGTTGGNKPSVASNLPTSSSPGMMVTLSLQDVHQHFSQTQERLKQQADELEKAVKRRQEAKQETQERVEKHRQDLKSTGSSLEFYQTWRRELIAFVGALREITKALPEMQTAWHELEQDMAGIEKWKWWEDDTFAVLTRYKLVQSVVGRQPDVSEELLTNQRTEVDEFGRDISSQKDRVLQQRRLQRRNARKEAVVESGMKHKMGAESGHDVSVPPHLNKDYAYPTGYPVLTGPTEMENFRERNKSLQNALKVVLDNLYQEYTSLPQLFELFAQWKRSFPAEYKECYASLTLADLATVLILVELLSLNDPLNESGGHDEAKWITTVCRFYNCEKQGENTSSPGNGTEIKLFDKDSIERLVSKAVLPTLQDLLSEKRTYNLLSARQSKALSAFLSNAQRLLPQHHPVLTMVHKVVVDYIQRSLEELSIPLVLPQTVVAETLDQVHDPEEKELLGQTIHDATIGQIERVKKIMLNLFDCWAGVLPPESGFPTVMLQFMSSKVVPLLSALHTWYWPSLAESPADVFAQLWKEVKKHETWLEQPDNMLHRTVLNATAAAFQVDQDEKGPNDGVMGDLASDPVIRQAS